MTDIFALQVGWAIGAYRRGESTAADLRRELKRLGYTDIQIEAEISDFPFQPIGVAAKKLLDSLK